MWTWIEVALFWLAGIVLGIGIGMYLFDPARIC